MTTTLMKWGLHPCTSVILGREGDAMLCRFFPNEKKPSADMDFSAS
jgi:hypothetical protein